MPSFGDAILVPFPFTDQSATKIRPAVVISRRGFNERQRDVLILAITGRIQPRIPETEALVADWRHAGLRKPSLMKPTVTTIDQRLIVRTLGAFSASDCRSLRTLLSRLIG